METNKTKNTDAQGAKVRARTVSLSQANLEDLRDNPKLLSIFIRTFEQSDANTSGGELMKFSKILLRQEDGTTGQ